MLSLICFIVVLGVLIIVHELGHFITAKRLGIGVERFSIGFGPKLYVFKKNDTEYAISAIPLGGYVKMAGEDPSEKLTGKKWEFLSRSVGDRFKVIFAGPLLNYVLAFAVFSVIFMFGNPTLTTEVGGLLKGYPAEAEGLSVGDKILSVDGKPVKYWEEMTALIHSHPSGTANLVIERGDRKMTISITLVVRKTKDIFGKEISLSLMGISPSQKIESARYDFFTSIGMGMKKLLNLTAVTYKALWYIVTGRLSVKESMTGPIGIFMVTGQAAKMGLIYIVHLMGVLSASLAIFNLLPLPVLDGGHILFLVVEKIRRKPLSLKTQEMINNFGVGMLLFISIFIFWNDIVKYGVMDKAFGLFKR